MSEMEELVAAIEDEFCASDRHCKVPEKVVRAVLLKLRDPSADMCHAALSRPHDSDDFDYAAIFRAMIDHIVGEQR